MDALIETEVNQIVTTGNSFAVNNQTDLIKATACLKGIKGLMDKVKESFDPIVDKAHKAHKEAIAQRDKYLKPLLDVDKKIRASLVSYNQKLETEQRERERIANEELAKVAEAERLKLINEANNTWDDSKAEELKEKASQIIPITVDTQKKVIEQEGLSIRKTWKARVIDANKVPREYMIVSEFLLNTVAKIEEKRKVGIPGVEFYQESSASVRV